MKKIEGKLYIIYTYQYGLPYMFLGKYRGKHYITSGQQYSIEVDLIRKDNGKIMEIISKDVYEIDKFAMKNLNSSQRKKIIRYVLGKYDGKI